MKRKVVVAGVIVAIAALMAAARGPKPPRPNPPGTWSFAVLGDAPYFYWEELQYKQTLKDLDAHPIDLAIHVGDIFWRPCTDDHYRKALARFNGLHHPLVLTPGDNEWRDCWEDGSGAFNPYERLASLRRIFFADPTHSLGHPQIAVVSQGGEFLENARWSDRGILFATTHVVGRLSAHRRPPPIADRAQEQRQMEAAASWVHETFAEAKRTNATAVVIAFQADPDFEQPFTDRFRLSFDPWMLALEEEAEQYPHPVLLAHGDGHTYTVDHVLRRRTTGRVLPNVTRLEVPGSPRVGWVRVVVTPGPNPTFAFDERVVPRLKYW